MVHANMEKLAGAADNNVDHLLKPLLRKTAWRSSSNYSLQHGLQGRQIFSETSDGSDSILA